MIYLRRNVVISAYSSRGSRSNDQTFSTCGILARLAATCHSATAAKAALDVQHYSVVYNYTAVQVHPACRCAKPSALSELLFYTAVEQYCYTGIQHHVYTLQYLERICSHLGDKALKERLDVVEATVPLHKHAVSIALVPHTHQGVIGSISIIATICSCCCGGCCCWWCCGPPLLRCYLASTFEPTFLLGLSTWPLSLAGTWGRHLSTTAVRGTNGVQ